MSKHELKNPVVVIFCHSRAVLLETAIKSFISAQESDLWKLVIVQQIGHPDVSDVINKYREVIDHLYSFSQVSEHYLANINFSRLSGWDIAFSELNSDFVIGIEEDTSIAQDALTFSRIVFQEFATRRKFRGINYASFLPMEDRLIHTYSLRRYGLSGQCGGIPRRTWDKFDLDCLLDLGSDEEWASHIEPIMKTGFTIFSNQSRAMDQGWGGTSNPDGKPTDEYFSRHGQSWVANHACHKTFQRLELDMEIWREDAIRYRPIHNIYFNLRENMVLQKVYKKFRRLGFPNMKVVILKQK